jgi:hypothetical protein
VRSALIWRVIASNLARRHNLAEFHGGHFHAPALGGFVELVAQHLIDVLALGQHIVQHDVADHRAQRRGRDAQRGLSPVANLQHAFHRLHHLPVDQKVNAD